MSPGPGEPLVPGPGTALFREVTQRPDLKLIDVRMFRSGNVLLRYEPAEKEN
jgi:hypothetical protein